MKDFATSLDSIVIVIGFSVEMSIIVRSFIVTMATGET